MTFTVLLSAIALIGCGGGGSSSNPAATATAAGETANLAGQVIMSGQPLANASVFLYKSDKAHTAGIENLASMRAALLPQTTMGEGMFKTISDNDGAYSFLNVPLGEYTLIAMKDENHQYAQTGIFLSTRAQTTTLNAQLTPTGKISGKVVTTVSASTQNVASAFVYISGTSYVALTDANGDFTINNVPSNPAPAAAYTIQVMSSMGGTTQTGVVVQPGQTNNLGNISVANPVQQTATINGSITGTAGHISITNKMILLSSPDGKVFLATHTDNNGAYSFIVKQTGAFNIRAVPENNYDYNPSAVQVTVSALGGTAITSPSFTPQLIDAPAVIATPTSIQVIHITDKNATIKWENPGLAQKTEIEFPVGGTINSAYGNTFEFINLSPSTTHNYRIRNVYKTQTSDWVSASFVTQPPGLSGIMSMTFVEQLPAGATIFGFEVDNGTGYVGYTSGFNGFIRAYNMANGNQIGSDYSFTLTNTTPMYFDRPKMTLSSQGIFFLYENGSGIPYLGFINRDLAAASVVSKSMQTGGFGYTSFASAVVKAFNNKIFLLVTHSQSLIHLSEIDSNLDYIGSPYTYDAGAGATLSQRTADISYDATANRLYLAHQYDTGDPIHTIIKAFPAMNLSSASVLGYINVVAAPFLSFVSGSNKVFLITEDAASPRLHVFDGQSGYQIQQTLGFNSTGLDKKNRIWFAGNDKAGSDKYFIVKNEGLATISSVKNNILIENVDTIKLDRANGMMYMLFQNALNQLAVYKYNSNF